MAELRSALEKMKSGKAPRGDGIPAEMLKAGLGEDTDLGMNDEDTLPMLQVLLRLTNFAFKNGVVADAWAESTLRVICVVLSKRLNAVFETNELFSQAQAGFR